MSSVILLPLQAVLACVVRGVTKRQPSLFERLGHHAASAYLIDPVNLPIVLVLKPDPHEPQLRAFWRHAAPQADCRISGGFLTLLALVDGRRDGDAVFFSRDLVVTGDIDAVVTLRNALDDLDVTLIQDIVSSAGLLSRPLARLMQFLRAFDNSKAPHAS
ncbi:MAG: SCP2 sterol-binding domain-containing protein [Rhizobiales bacterium]|nr:SCP2 sterol-binding domain-containing protein [Hyphomicrobiales bacterium]MBI3672623.1 SCP2 sterol-binding domain-containing protein [Hyphomicrobiales bacterium]